MTHPFSRRDWLIVAAAALAVALGLVYGLSPRPTSLDSYYHYNAAARFATGRGLTDTYLWIYLGLPDSVPPPIVETPSHLYWMPGTSLLSAASMTVGGVSYGAAQLPMAICLAAAILIAALFGGWVSGERRQALLAAVMMAAASSYTDLWGEIDTLAPYAAFGSAALAAIVQARVRNSIPWWFAAGLLCGAGHLIRSDGLLLVIVGMILVLTSSRKSGSLALIPGYFAVIGPWMIRMIGVTGSPLPIGGLQTAYLTEYIQIFRYPWQDLSLGTVGLPSLMQSRADALPGNLATMLVSEGWLFLWPLTLWGLLRAPTVVRMTVGLFALGLHAAMILIFAWPAARGGLFHGASALMPCWAALTVFGADALARRLTRGRPRRLPAFQTMAFGAVVCLALLATFYSVVPLRAGTEPESIAVLRPVLSANDRVMATDPAQNYFFLGTGGVVLPDAPLERLPEMAETFDLDYLVLEGIAEQPDGSLRAISPRQFDAILVDTPPFLELVEDFGHTRLFRFRR